MKRKGGGQRGSAGGGSGLAGLREARGQHTDGVGRDGFELGLEEPVPGLQGQAFEQGVQGTGQGRDIGIRGDLPVLYGPAEPLGEHLLGGQPELADGLDDLFFVRRDVDGRQDHHAAAGRFRRKQYLRGFLEKIPLSGSSF